jgi:1,4-alpha-glucan branching enzyme
MPFSLAAAVGLMLFTGASADAHVFSYKAAAGTRSVTVAGSFNGWNPSANPLSDADGDGVWTTDVALKPGSHQYKFVVNGSDWLTDPANPKKTPDGLGGDNSVVDVAAAGAPPATSAPPASTAPAATTAATAGPTFSFRAPAGARSVAVAGSFNNWSTSATAMSDADGDGVWTSDVKLPVGTHQYKFVVNGSDWVMDPTNPKKADDGLGGENSVIVVAAAAAATATTAAAPAASAATPAASAPTGRTVSAGGNVPVVFRWSGAAQTVHLAGEFNNWLDNVEGRVTGHSDWMLEKDASGAWTLTVLMRPGTYKYKFVCDGSRWEKDPARPVSNDDNSLVVVSATAAPPASAPAAPTAPSAGATGANRGQHTFQYRSASGTRSVVVAGSFNNWSTSATPMSDADGDGVWTADVALSPGKHQYKFVVNASDWVVDPSNASKADDGMGGENSVVEVR